MMKSRPSTASCAAYLADDRRRALLADIGAGTVDQVLLAVLPSKFNTLRLFALADKVLVIDEAHAFDAYMGVGVRELLRFHAALGGSAIVLSATLPSAQREAMAAAWADGLNDGRRRGAANRLTSAEAYPLATLVSGRPARVEEHPLDAAEWSRRCVPVRMVSNVGDALAHVLDMQRQGGAVVWIRNTVDDCLAAAALLRASGVEPTIFHARFAQGDRQTREREVVEMFGRAASAEPRAGRVLVATQVVEQSLDLDFDAMVSDLAPVDLLVQRAGRLWRHPERARPFARDACELVVLAPPYLADPPANWLGGIFAGTAYVYGNAGVLWRTVRVLDDAGEIRTPEGLRALVGAVYDSVDVPDALARSAATAEGTQHATTSIANYATLKVSDGYDATAHAWVSDVRAPTRLGDEQTIVRLARVLPDGHLIPWIQDELEEWKAWALSEVRLSRWKVPAGAAHAPRFDGAIAALRSGWSAWEQDRPVLPLEEVAPGRFEGTLGPVQKARRISYQSQSGVAFPLHEGV